MNEAVLQAIEEHALRPEAVEQVIQLTERDDVRDQQAMVDRGSRFGLWRLSTGAGIRG